MEVQHYNLNATSIDEALAYIGIDANDFNLRNSDFTPLFTLRFTASATSIAR